MKKISKAINEGIKSNLIDFGNDKILKSSKVSNSILEDKIRKLYCDESGNVIIPPFDPDEFSAKFCLKYVKGTLDDPKSPIIIKDTKGHEIIVSKFGVKTHTYTLIYIKKLLNNLKDAIFLLYKSTITGDYLVDNDGRCINFDIICTDPEELYYNISNEEDKIRYEIYLEWFEQSKNTQRNNPIYWWRININPIHAIELLLRNAFDDPSIQIYKNPYIK